MNVAPGFVVSSDDSSSGRMARTAFETSTVLAAGSFVTEMVSAGSPFTREMLVTGLSVSSTDATSSIDVGSGSAWAAAPGKDAPAAPGADGSVAPSTGSAAISSTLPSVTPVCTAKVASPSVIVPAGTSRPFCCSASRIACWVMPRAASSAGSGVMVTRCPTSPMSVASRTPSRSRISASVVRSISSERALTSSAPVTAMAMTGKSSKLRASTRGSTSSGSCPEMRFTADSSFCSANARSVP